MLTRIALIPAYMPDEKMIDVARELHGEGFEVVIVNDGSPKEYDRIYDSAARYAEILRHESNRGKGEALKTGLSFISRYYNAPYTVVNADADGQHKTQDIIRVTETAEVNRSGLVLGSRKLEGKVPFKSRFGNAITRFVYRLSTKASVYDTQTGLRAYSDKLIDNLIEIKGSRYEYEMNMLMELPREGYEIKEVWIDTVYINNNAASHFDPVKDSAKIYKEILKFSASSLLSFGVDYALFCLLSALTGSLVFSNIFARIVSGTVNFTVNRKVVFKSQSNVAVAALKYVSLAISILICNTVVLEVITSLGLAAYIAKIITEAILFILSYTIQHSLIFQKGRERYMKKHLYTLCAAIVLIAFTTYISLDTFVISTSYAAATEMNTSMFSAESGNSDSAVTSDSAAQAQDSQSQSSSDSSNASGDKSNNNSSGNSGSDSGSSSKHGPGSHKNRASIGFNGGSYNSSDNSSSGSSGIDASSSYSGDSTVTTDNYTITLTEYYQNNTKIYVADVTLTSAQYLKTAFANDTYGKNVTATTSSIAQSKNAILAINGDYYGVQESGYVIRNGIVYRSTAKGCDVLCIYADGTMEIVSDSEYTADELVAKGVWQAFTFGPSLVENSSVTVGVNDEVGKAMASNPRTAIGIIDANHFVFVVSDGRTSESAGLSLYELATFMQSLGVKTAYNLDGGGSSTMYFNGSVVNNPTTGGSIKERGVSDIVYIG